MKRALQPQALPDFKPGCMPFSIDRPLSAMVLAALLVLTTSSCHKKQVAVPVPSEPVPAVTAPAVEPTPSSSRCPHSLPPLPLQPRRLPLRRQRMKPNIKRTSRRISLHRPSIRLIQPLRLQPPPPSRARRLLQRRPTPRAWEISLSPDQQREYNTAIDLSLAHAQASLGFISTRQLTHEQQSTVAEIQNFIQQAQEKRKNELEAAKSLAERAEVLSHDLVASLR